MADQEYINEVESRLLSYIETRRDPTTGLWVVELMTELLGYDDKGPLPMTDDIYETQVVKYRIGLPGSDPSYPKFGVRTGRILVRKERAWAGVPRFKTEDAAISKMRGWIYSNRPDIVNICHGETREAIAYRRRQAND